MEYVYGTLTPKQGKSNMTNYWLNYNEITRHSGTAAPQMSGKKNRIILRSKCYNVQNKFMCIISNFAMSILQNEEKMQKVYKIFAHIKKKQYLCIRFKKRT